MSFNRLQYDTCAYRKNLKESLNVGCYQMYGGKYDNQNKCRIEFGIIGGNNVSTYKGNQVDLESDLRGQTRPLSLCPKHKYMPVCNQPCTEGLPSGPLDCNSELTDLPTCQMFSYKPVAIPKQTFGSYCPTKYLVASREQISKSTIKENFCQGCSDNRPDSSTFPNKLCPYASPAPFPEKCNCQSCNSK